MTTQTFPSWAPADAVWLFQHEIECNGVPANASEGMRVRADCSKIAHAFLTDDRARRIWEKLVVAGVDVSKFLSLVSGWGAWVSNPSIAADGDHWGEKTRKERRESMESIIALVDELASKASNTPLRWCEENGGAARSLESLQKIRGCAEVLADDEPAFGRNDDSRAEREIIVRLSLFFERQCGKKLAPTICDCVELIFGGQRVDETRVHQIMRDFKARNSVKAKTLLNRGK